MSDITVKVSTKIKKKLEKDVYNLIKEKTLLEYNNEKTRKNVEEQILNFISENFSLKITPICNETNNTPSIIDQNQLVVDIVIEYKKDLK